MSQEYVPISGLVKFITKKAVLFIIDDEEYWVPVSQIFEDDLAEIDEGVIGEINVSEWFYDREIA